jgi:soluble lytic murein transglycosylase
LERAAASPDLPRLQVIAYREQLALARLRADDPATARADYTSLLSAARSDSYRAELNYILGVLEPDPAAAAGRFRTAVQTDPKGRAAQAALDELVALGDDFALSFEAGETRFEQDRYREALAAYTSFIASAASDSRVPKAYYGRGVSLVRLGQDRAGIVVLESIADRFPNTLDAADGTFRGGRIRESLADLDGAAASYRKAMSQPGAGVRATDAQFRLAFVQFRQGRFAEAASGWRDLAGRVTAAEERSQALFWLGKALVSSGDSAGAAAAWSAARSADPRGFYGVRADDLLAGRADPRASSSSALSTVDAPADIRAWVATRSDGGSASARLSGDPTLPRAERLLSLGLRREAIWELDALAARLGDSTSALALLGAWEQERGLYNTALLLAYDLGISSVSGPAAVRELFYPLPHPVVLARSSQELRVDPLLFAALMLQESNMDQDVESAAQARGLSQLIASTAHEAARALGVYNFQSSDLFKPATSIHLGAYTLSRRVARYDNLIFPSLAAYNASQFAVDGWLLSAGEADIDTFAEAIPFTETYPYVQRIYTNYRQYQELYAPR